MVRVASPIFTHKKPPFFNTRKHSVQTLSNSWCINSKASSGLVVNAFPIFGFCVDIISSHISIIGYGGEVTIKFTDSSAVYDIFWDAPMYMLCSVCISKFAYYHKKRAKIRKKIEIYKKFVYFREKKL